MLRLRLGKNTKADEHPSSEHSAPVFASTSEHAKPIGAEDQESTALENFVIGGEQEFLKKLGKNLQDDESSSDSEDDLPSPEQSNDNEVRRPVWVDEDDKLPIEIPKKRRLQDLVDSVKHTDEGLLSSEYAQRLKKRFDDTNVTATADDSTPSWALPDHDKKKRRRRKSEDSDTDEDDDLSKQTGNYIGSSVHIQKGNLKFKKLRDVNNGYRVKAILKSVEFHKQAPMVLVAGYTQSALLFQIDGKENPLLQSIAFENFPIETAHFTADGEKFVVGSMLQDFFYYYDMAGGKAVKVPRLKNLNQVRMGKFVVSPDGTILAFQGTYGYIYFLSAKSFELIGSVKMNGYSTSLAFSSTGSTLYTHGYDGEVYVWDVRQRQCAHRFFDDGCVKGMCVAVSPSDRFLATGSNTGVVNVYETEALRNTSKPTPVKTLMNLTTSAKSLAFNATDECMAFASDIKEKQFRLLHTNSMTTFDNFPHPGDKLGKVHCMDFSLNSGYMCVGTEDGRASLYRLHHYKEY